MDMTYARLRHAVVAAWISVIIGFALLLVMYVGMLIFLRVQPGWLLSLWGGGDLDWPWVHRMWITAMGIWKMLLWLWILFAVWLTVWAKRLKKDPAA